MSFPVCRTLEEFSEQYDITLLKGRPVPVLVIDADEVAAYDDEGHQVLRLSRDDALSQALNAMSLPHSWA